MPRESYSDADRLAALASIVIDYLDAVREAEGVDERDESHPRCDVYNAAYAVVERDTAGGAAHMDRELFGQLANIAAEAE